MALAGVDFSQLGGSNQSTVPEFYTEREAISWAKDVKWVETLRQELRKKRVSIIREISSMNASDPKKVEELLNQWSRYNMALNIMEEYKKMGVKGASFYAGSEPL